MEILGSIIQLVFGLIIAILGGLLLWYAWHRKLSSQSLQGEIVGVHEEHDEQGQLFRPVISYIDASGQKKKMLSDSAVRSMSKVQIGATLGVIVDPADPAKTATTSTLNVFVAIGFVLFTIGATVVYFAATELSFSVGLFGQIGIVVVLLAMGLAPLRKMIRFAKDPAMIAAWRAEKRKQLAVALEESDELNVNEVAARIKIEDQERAHLQDQAARIAYPIRIVIGMALLIVYGPWSFNQLAFLASATAAEGVVVRNEYTTSRPNNLASPISGYFAIIEYRTASGANRTLRDWFALKRPQFDNGEKVRVLYDAADPTRALPDRGMWNWLPPTMVLLLSALFMLQPLRKFVTWLQRKRESDPVQT